MPVAMSILPTVPVKIASITLKDASVVLSSPDEIYSDKAAELVDGSNKFHNSFPPGPPTPFTASFSFEVLVSG